MIFLKTNKCVKYCEVNSIKEKKVFLSNKVKKTKRF